MTTDVYPSMVVADSDQQERIVEPMQLGKQVKAIRKKNKLTLEEAGKLTGLARSTLSKIENEQISPTFAVMQKLAAGLNIDIPQLFTKPDVAQATGRRDVTKLGEGKPHLTSTYEHELLSTQLSNKKMMPYRSRIHARSFDDYGDWVRHEGEEFLLVLEGQVEIYTEFYEPTKLDVGDSVYYDATMGHVVISTSQDDALILWVTAR
ncbi:transcriptional regulator [Alteromonadales bacterium alter-6D02]|nr:transcriptional regulator [Alteromonadales bacterium alter-6D02]